MVHASLYNVFYAVLLLDMMGKLLQWAPAVHWDLLIIPAPVPNLHHSHLTGLCVCSTIIDLCIHLWLLSMFPVYLELCYMTFCILLQWVPTVACATVPNQHHRQLTGLLFALTFLISELIYDSVHGIYSHCYCAPFNALFNELLSVCNAQFSYFCEQLLLVLLSVTLLLCYTLRLYHDSILHDWACYFSELLLLALSSVVLLYVTGAMPCS